jgi:hypothetical protein
VSLEGLKELTGRLWFRKHCKHVVKSTILEALHAQHKIDPNFEDAEKGHKEPGIHADTGGDSEEACHSDQTTDTRADEDNDAPSRQVNRKADQKATSSDASPDRRHELRRRHGSQVRSEAPTPNDPHATIPHASSGHSRHTGRGGFPGLFELVSYTGKQTLPGQKTSLFSALRTLEGEIVHSSHPLQSLGKRVGQPFKDYADKGEANHAQSARWLPPGVRGIVVGRNSQFFEEELSDEDLELIGALEYRATKVLTTLLIVVSCYTPRN